MTQEWPGQEVTGQQAAPQGGPQPIFTVPDPIGDQERARDNRDEMRDERSLTLRENADSRAAESAARSPAQTAADTAFGKEFVDWTVNGGRADWEKSRVQLREVINALESGDKNITGPITGSLPDFVNLVTNPDAINYRDLIEEIVQRNLRLVLGAQFTEKEGERLIQRAFNPRLSEEQNLSRVTRLLQQIEQAGAQKEAAVRFYEENGTLQGWDGSVPTADDSNDPAGVVGTEMVAGGDGDRFVTDLDKEFARRANELWASGASVDQMNALAAELGYEGFSSNPALNDMLAARESGTVVPWAPPQSGERSVIDKALGNAADSSIGAYFGGAANALTGGTLDEIAGAIGGEDAGKRAQFAKEYMREQNPIASFAGEATGGIGAMLPAAKLAQVAGKTALAGEVAYGAAYGAGENNENRLAGAAAGAGGAVAGDYLGKKLMQRFGRKIPAEAGREGVTEAAEEVPAILTPAQRYERAQRYGVDLSIGDVRGRGAKAVERNLDAQAGSATAMNQAREQTREQIIGAVDDVAATYGGGATADSMGDSLQAGARKWIARAKGEKGNPLDRGIIGKAYDAIPIGANAPAQREATLSALEEINSQFSSNPKLRELMKDTRATRMLDALGDAESDLSWSDLKALRSAVGEDMAGLRIGSQDSRQSTLARLYGALSDDMRATARARGPVALAKFERANSLNRAVEARIESTLTTILGKDGMQSAEKAAGKVRAMAMSGRQTSDFRQLAEIRKSMPSAEWNEVAGTLVRLLGQPANSEGRDFAPQTFVRNFGDMSAAAKNLIFGGPNSTLRKNLDEFAKVIDDVAGSDATRNTSNTSFAQATTVTNMMGGAMGAASGGPLGAIFGMAATQLGAGGLARIWTHPPFVRWATGYTKMMKKAAQTGQAPPEAAIKSQLAHLDRVAKGSGPVSADVILFRDYLGSQFSEPARLAAENNPDRMAEDSRTATAGETQ